MESVELAKLVEIMQAMCSKHWFLKYQNYVEKYRKVLKVCIKYLKRSFSIAENTLIYYLMHFLLIVRLYPLTNRPGSHNLDNLITWMGAVIIADIKTGHFDIESVLDRVQVHRPQRRSLAQIHFLGAITLFAPPNCQSMPTLSSERSNYRLNIKVSLLFCTF